MPVSNLLSSNSFLRGVADTNWPSDAGEHTVFAVRSALRPLTTEKADMPMRCDFSKLEHWPTFQLIASASVLTFSAM
jgi:hypothetical protein